MLERVLAEQLGLQMRFDDAPRAADVGRLAPADQSAVGADLHEQALANVGQRRRNAHRPLHFVLERKSLDAW